MKPDIGFDTLFSALADTHRLHAPGTPTYRILQAAAAQLVARCALTESPARPFAFGPFGDLMLPFRSMGACDTRNLLEIDELIIFSYYWIHRSRYRRTLDIGANIGLHSIIMARSGFSVTAFEPDPKHFGWLDENLKLNHIERVKPVQAAVSDRDGQLEFVRVLGNTTGSHLAGAKNPYGELERFPVRVESIARHLNEVDFMKVDAEGHEPEILAAVPADAWQHCDAMVEIGSAANAERIFHALRSHGLNLFPQKLGWNAANSVADLPTSHHEGSLFISRQASMRWTP